MISHLSPLSSMILQLSSSATLWILSPNDFRLVSHLSPWIVRPHDFRLGAHLYCTSLPLVSEYILDALSALPRMILHLSCLSPSCLQTLWILCCVISYLSPTCLPVQSGCSALVSMISHLHSFPAILWHAHLSQHTLDALSALVAVYRRVCPVSCCDSCLRSPAVICVSLAVWFAVHRRVCCCCCIEWVIFAWVWVMFLFMWMIWAWSDMSKIDMRQEQKQTLLQTTLSRTCKWQSAIGGDNRGKSNSKRSCGLQTTRPRTRKLRPASGISLTLNIPNITRTNIAPHLKPLTQYIQFISRISFSPSSQTHITSVHLYHSVQSPTQTLPSTPAYSFLDSEFGKTSCVGLSGPLIASNVGSN